MRLLEEPTFEIAGWKSNYTIRAPILHYSGTVLCLAASSLSQTDRAGLRGTVPGPSGRVVPQAHFTAVEISTGLKSETTSTVEGTYDSAELPGRNHTITFENVGFKANATAFATPADEFGAPPCNRLPGQDAWEIDFAASKTILLTERPLEFRSVFYNILKYPPSRAPQSPFNPLNTTGFGRSVHTVNTASAISRIGSGGAHEFRFVPRVGF
jgi:hypothetical protein